MTTVPQATARSEAGFTPAKRRGGLGGATTAPPRIKMFDSKEMLSGQIQDLLATLLGVAQGRYACLVEPSKVTFEAHAPDEPVDWGLRRLLEEKSSVLFGIPEGLASDAPMDDLFEGWDRDDFLLAFVNGRVALVIACPDAEAARDRILEPLRVLVDRLLRFKEAYRMDARGRGLFFGRPRLDLVVVGRGEGTATPEPA